MIFFKKLTKNNISSKFNSLENLINYVESMDDCRSEYSGGWQSVEFANLIINAKNAIIELKKDIEI